MTLDPNCVKHHLRISMRQLHFTQGIFIHLLGMPLTVFCAKRHLRIAMTQKDFAQGISID